MIATSVASASAQQSGTAESHLTGDWGQVRSRLENRGLSFDLTTTSDVSGIGGHADRTRRYGRALTTAGLTFDFEKIAGLKGSRGLVRYEVLGRANGALSFPPTQAYSNIDADPFKQFVELWLEQQVGESLRIKTGVIDANTEFAFAENNGDFINSSMGHSPTVFPMPTYPDSRVGMVVHADLSKQAYASVGVFDGGPAMGVDDFRAGFVMGEAGLRWNAMGGGRIGVGYWLVRGKRAAVENNGDLDDLVPVSTGGKYLVLDQTLWSVQRGGVTRSISTFFQTGTADPRLSTTSFHVGTGLVARGFISNRPDDSIGLGVTAVSVSPGTSDAGTGYEVAFEAFRRFVITKWAALRPDVQFIKTAGTAAGRRAILAGTFRFELVF